MNELTEFGQINGGLARRYGAQSPLVHTMASDGFPIIHVGDDGMDSSLAWLAQLRLCSGFVSQAQDAANQSAIALVNPASSGSIAVLDRVDLFVGAAGIVYITSSVGPTFVGGPGYIRDTRAWRTSIQRTSCQLSAAVGAFSSTLGRYRIVTAAQTYEIRGPWVITPGQLIAFANDQVNISMSATFYWRERRVGSQELGE